MAKGKKGFQKGHQSFWTDKSRREKSERMRGKLPANLEQFKNYWLGKKHPHKEETKIKISLSLKGRKPKNFGNGWGGSGENSTQWKGGIILTPDYKKVHREANREMYSFYNRKRRYFKKGATGSHSLEEWNELRKVFSYMCLCCKQQEPFIKLTEDHIVPISLGGSNDIENIQPLCIGCNSRKHTATWNYINNTTILL
mgnify:CR=1 FL=1